MNEPATAGERCAQVVLAENRSADTATAEDVRRFQVYMSECGAKPPKLNSATSALRFFFGTTLDRAELARYLAAYTIRGRYHACFHPRR